MNVILYSQFKTELSFMLSCCFHTFWFSVTLMKEEVVKLVCRTKSDLLSVDFGLPRSFPKEESISEKKRNHCYAFLCALTSIAGAKTLYLGLANIFVEVTSWGRPNLEISMYFLTFFTINSLASRFYCRF